ncbi:MAG TPA: Gfo/Idh/MocA family oxidoreductase [Acidimicrobiales bacterium]|jgi:predicted dehydrogenase
MPDPIRVGVVGANPTRGWALGAHLPALAALPEFELVAVATTREASARETAQRFGVPHAFGDPAGLIEHPDVDLVTVSVKVPDHVALVRSALEAGKHVFCEWPLAPSSTEAGELLALARARGVRHVTGLQGRCSPMVNYVRDLLAQGFVGELLSVGLTVALPGPGGVVPEDLVWTTDRANGAGTLPIIGGHTLDVLRYIVGDLVELQSRVAVRWPVATLVGTTRSVPVTSPDSVMVQGRLERGAFVQVSVLGGLPGGSGSRLELQGTEGALVMSGRSVLHGADTLLGRSTRDGRGELAALRVPNGYRTGPEALGPTAARQVAGLYLTLARAIGSGQDPELLEPSFATALSLHRLLDTIEESSAGPDNRPSRPEPKGTTT